MNLQHLKITIIVFFLLSFFMIALTESTPINQIDQGTIIAKMNGISLTYEHVDNFLEQLHEAGEETAILSKEEANYLINNLIEDFLANPEKVIASINQPNFPAINPVVQAD